MNGLHYSNICRSLARAYAGLSKFNEALSYANKALTITPDSLCYSERARIFIKAGTKVEALNDLRMLESLKSEEHKCKANYDFVSETIEYLKNCVNEKSTDLIENSSASAQC